MVILLAAVLFAVSKRPVSRFAMGFAVTGWLYLVLTFSGLLGVREHLLTERVSGWLCQLIHEIPGAYEPPMVSLYRSEDYVPGSTSRMVPFLSRIDPNNFAAISRSLWTLLLATIGGGFASWLGRRRDRDNTQADE